MLGASTIAKTINLENVQSDHKSSQHDYKIDHITTDISFT